MIVHRITVRKHAILSIDQASTDEHDFWTMLLGLEISASSYNRRQSTVAWLKDVNGQGRLEAHQL